MEKFSTSALFISHGGGPLPLLGDESHQALVEHLKNIATLIEKPSAIIVISAHWEANTMTLTGAAKPALIYDYYGFPAASYEIEYPVPGDPDLAGKIFDLMQHHGIQTVIDEQRGFDHGLFVPLKIMYPDADIPCVQLSLLGGLDPAEHIKIGQALAGLNEKNLLVLGSGFSFHNMREFFSPSTPESSAMNGAFEQWLCDTCASHELSEEERTQRLINWEQAPAARYCHPREEHLLPLHVCYGYARQPAKQVFELEILRKQASMYLW